MSTIDIEPSDVIKLIEQYLKENNLLKTLQSLQNETSVSLNTVDSLENFVNDINSGHWDIVLRTIRLFKLPDNKLYDLYEQIVIELIELREIKAANWLISKTEPLQKLKSSFPDRYLRLQYLLGRSFFDHNEAYRGGGSKDRRRTAIAQELKKEISVVGPQRLLGIIGDAIKWQNHEGLLTSGSAIDIFTGKTRISNGDEEKPPSSLHKHCIKPLKPDLEGGGDDQEHPIFVCCCEFSIEGQYLIVGYSTGLIEIRNSSNGRIAKDLKYQTQENFMITPSKSAVLCLCFSINELMAVGDKSGDISVWRLETGQLIQNFKAAHTKGITCLLFHRSGKEILSGSHDNSVRLHGMRSNRTIRDFRGHKSFVQSIVYSRDDNFVISGSSDKTVRIWNSKTAQEVALYSSASRVHSIYLMPQFKSDIFLIGSRGSKVHFIDLAGKLRAKLTYQPRSSSRKIVASISNNPEDTMAPSGNTDELEIESSSNKKNDDNIEDNNNVQKDPSDSGQEIQFYSVCPSPKGNWIYAVDSKDIYCFNYAKKRVEKRLRVHDEMNNDLIGVKHHPFLNLLATHDTQGNLKLWKD